MRPIVKSIKHYNHTAKVGISSGANLLIDVVVTIAKGAAVTLATQVEEGAIIKAVYFEN